MSARRGYIASIAGPVVVAKGLSGVKMGEVVYVGEEQLVGEVVRLSSNYFTVQVYEDTNGLRPKEPVISTGKLLVAELGPGLLSVTFDGIERPLRKLESK